MAILSEAASWNRQYNFQMNVNVRLHTVRLFSSRPNWTCVIILKLIENKIKLNNTSFEKSCLDLLNYVWSQNNTIAMASFLLNCENQVLPSIDFYFNYWQQSTLKFDQMAKQSQHRLAINIWEPIFHPARLFWRNCLYGRWEYLLAPVWCAVHSKCAF